jgi:dTDP-4-amino-4,6-dideoxygalactose transaminase
MFDNGWLTNRGPFVLEFEKKIAEFVGVKHCVAMCNATIALEIAFRALELKGEVIVPSYTFIATAHALQWQEITPVFADIDPRTHNIDPSRIEELITPRTTGIVGVHVWGRSCDTEAIEAIGARRGLKVMYDAAHALGCTHGGRQIGGFGRCEVLSFHATKFLNSFEGGAVVTDDDQLAAKIRLMCNFGFAGYDNVIYPGTNGKMTEVCAAMGITSFESMAELVATNQRNYQSYQRGLDGVRGLSLIRYDLHEANNFQYIVLEIDPEDSGLTRDELVEVLHAENILARKYFWPGCHRMEPYKSFNPHAKLLLPETERVAARVMVLPTGLATEEADIQIICEIIRNALSIPAEVRRALAERRTQEKG